MATQIKLRRGTTAEHSTFTGALAEITVDTTKKTVVVHDGSTAGGFPLALASAGGSAATPTALGTVYGKMTTSGASPYLTALGYNSAASTTGIHNTVVGYNVLNSNTTGTYNTGIGSQALASNTGSRNTAVGATVMRVTTGSENVGVGTEDVGGGYSPFWSNTSGSYNIAVGNGGLGKNTTGANNTAIGHTALYNNTTASNNTVIGYQAGYTNTTGTQNVAMGSGALYSNSTNNDNTAVGYQAGYSATGNGNTCLGTLAGKDTVALTTGYNNTILGAYCRTTTSVSINQVVIGYNITGQADSNVTIGSASGKIYNAFTVNATWTQTSDGRLKTNVQNDTLGLSFINRLRPVKFNWKASNEIDPSLPYYNEVNERDTQTVIHGLIAQEVKEALDAEGVDTFAGWDEGPDGIQAISREMFISPLIKAVQELKAELDAAKAEIAALKGA